LGAPAQAEGVEATAPLGTGRMVTSDSNNVSSEKRETLCSL
jgi:hypothetical protein